jgi:NitT/TauT family transport system permease protein
MTGKLQKVLHRYYEYFLIPVCLVVFIVIWDTIAKHYPPYILPSPGAVWDRYREFLNQGMLAKHFLATLAEASSGFGISLIIALPLSYLFARHPAIEKCISPYIIAIQAVPIVSLAPLLVIWFGFDQKSKILVATLVSFFPILTNGIVGFRETDQRLRDLMAIMGANRQQFFLKLDLPSALPVLFGGFKLGATLAVIGAVVGEFAGAGKGLGYLVNSARGSFDTPLMFVALILLAALGLGFYLALSLLEIICIPWKRPDK